MVTRVILAAISDERNNAELIVRPDKNTRALAGTPVGNGFPSTGGVVGDFPQPMLPYPVFSKAYLLILF
jgi:hypothetical protein